MKAVGDVLHRDLGVTSAMRAVMEFLAENGEHTVPQVARAKNVTRQHIQTLVNRLDVSGLVSIRPNPADKRSPLIDLNDAGKKTFAAMRRREKAVFDGLGLALARCDLDATLTSLGALRQFLDTQLTKGDHHD